MAHTQRTQAPQPELGVGGLRVGRLTKPHGLKGAIKVELYTDSPDTRFVPGAVFHLQVPTDSAWFKRTLTLRELRWFNDQPVGFFEEVPDRTAAESVVRAILWIDAETVADGAEDDAWYDDQLVGMRVLRDGVDIGAVTAVQHLPAHDLLEVASTEHGTVLVPLVEEIVPEVNLDDRTVTVTPPAGLFESLPEDERAH